VLLAIVKHHLLVTLRGTHLIPVHQMSAVKVGSRRARSDERSVLDVGDLSALYFRNQKGHLPC
jgi:hypothetical protein